MIKHFLSITQLEQQDIAKILTLSVELQNHVVPTLEHKNILFAFQKPSLRTKIGTEVAINKLQGHVIHITPDNFFEGNILWSGKHKTHIKGRESLKDTVKNVAQWCDAIFARVYDHRTLVEMTTFSDIPIVNALCNKHHPMQAFADLLTIREYFGNQKITLTFIGDANNVTFSLFEILLKSGHKCRLASPPQYSFSPQDSIYLNQLALQHNTSVTFSENPTEAIKNVDLIYTDTFVSMGEENILAEKMKYFTNYQVNESLFSKTSQNTLFMHCLPAHRNVEVTDDIIDSKRSIVYQQAKNRMVVAKGIFTYLLNPNYELK